MEEGEGNGEETGTKYVLWGRAKRVTRVDRDQFLHREIPNTPTEFTPDPETGGR